MITNIKLEYEDSDIELTLDEAKELYKDLHELFGKEKIVSVPTSWPHPEFYRPSGPSYTTTTTPLTDWRQQPYCGTDVCRWWEHVSPARVAGATAGKGSRGKK